MKLTQTKTLQLSAVTPYAKNVKKHSEEQVENLKKLVEKFGYIQPIVVDENGVIVIGHARYQALVELWHQEADCVVLSGFTKDEINAMRIADNKVNESPYDVVNLRDELKALQGMDDLLDMTCFSDIELGDLGFYDMSKSGLTQVGKTEDGNLGTKEFEEIDGGSVEGMPEYAPQTMPNLVWNQETKKPITFYVDGNDFETLHQYFATNRKREHNVQLLLEIVNFYIENKTA